MEKALVFSLQHADSVMLSEGSYRRHAVRTILPKERTKRKKTNQTQLPSTHIHTHTLTPHILPPINPPIHRTHKYL